MSARLAVAVALDLWMVPGGSWRKESRVVGLIAM